MKPSMDFCFFLLFFVRLAPHGLRLATKSISFLIMKSMQEGRSDTLDRQGHENKTELSGRGCFFTLFGSPNIEYLLSPRILTEYIISETPLALCCKEQKQYILICTRLQV